jgi:Plasmid pRiA4b ORF-3-like protein
MSDSEQITVYQLKIFILGISPMIWRRIKVRSDSTIADLHYIIQIAMGWTDSQASFAGEASPANVAHLHRFVIHGKDYGIAQIGGISFSDDPRKVKLADLGWRVKERFLYEYDFGDYWQHQIRVEKILTSKSNNLEPICISGKRACPPEDCGGAWQFMAKKQEYWVGHIVERVTEIVEADEIADSMEEISQLRQWLLVDHFDLENINSRLKQYATGDLESILFEQRIG